jgi:hypothetical protein
MLFKVSFLTKSFTTIFAFKSFDARVKANVVFNVAGFVECLAATVD